MSVLSLSAPALPDTAPALAPGSRKLAAPGRPVDRPTLTHHVAVLPLPSRTLALLTGSAPDATPAGALLVRWAAARLRALSVLLVSGETSAASYGREASGLAGFGPDPAPGGEEILVGLAAAAHRLGSRRLLSEPAVAAFSASLLGLAGAGVPRLVRQALQDAARGGFPASVASVAEILGDPDAEDGALKEAVVRLVAGGVRPGADSLAGIVTIARDVALGRL